VQTQKNKQHAFSVVIGRQGQSEEKNRHQKKRKWDAEVQECGACDHEIWFFRAKVQLFRKRSFDNLN
jgi:hypothetical protein